MYKRFRKLNRKKKNAVVLLIICILALGIIGVDSFANKKNKEKEEKINLTISQAKKMTDKYMYDEAIEIIDNSDYSDDERIQTVRKNINVKKSELVEYEGQIYHVFFHSLIVYPKLAFDGDYKHEGYDMWMTTVSEFKAMLPQMYERGFVLYSLADIKKGKKILLPPGKKPLIISVDDVNYYDYMEGDGFADRLTVDENENVVCEVKTPDGKTELSYEGDVMPILDKFVEKHPDFSFRGAKGIVAVTGYEGVFGYNFEDAEGEEKTKLMKEANKVAKALKKSGWLLACHSYTHNGYFRDGKVGDKELSYDTNKFNTNISETVLNPDIYISPFGYFLGEGDERLQYLKDMGYDYFCPVSPAMRTLYTNEDMVISERLNLDRYNMRKKKKYINENFFDVDSVYYNALNN